MGYYNNDCRWFDDFDKGCGCNRGFDNKFDFDNRFDNKCNRDFDKCRKPEKCCFRVECKKPCFCPKTNCCHSYPETWCDKKDHGRDFICCIKCDNH